MLKNVYQIIVALLVAVFDKKTARGMEFVERNENLLGLTIFCHVLEGTCRFRFLDNFMFGQLFPGNFPSNLQFLFLLKLHNLLFDPGILILFKIFTALPDSFPNLIKPRNNILSNSQLQFTDILVINTFNCVFDELFIDAFTEQRAGF